MIWAVVVVRRGDRATARDLFDLAIVVEREPGALAAAAPSLMRRRHWWGMVEEWRFVVLCAIVILLLGEFSCQPLRPPF